jgi:hypothetical protein
MAPRPLKKTETIEIRLPHETKTAFMARCRAEGRTASHVLRRFIDAELAARPRRFDGRLLLAAVLAALALGGVAAPSLAESVTPTRTAFDRLDRDHDGRLSFEEFRAR